MAKKIGKAAMDMRINRIARLLSNGGTRSDCIQYASSTWGVGPRTTDTLIHRAREVLKEDWEIDRRTFTCRTSVTAGKPAKRGSQEWAGAHCPWLH